MLKELDCRGLACPAPVLRCKETLEKEAPNRLRVLVDNEAARQNVTRFLTSRGLSVQSEAVGTDFAVLALTGTAEPSPDPSRAQDQKEPHKRIMVLVGSDRLGHGDDLLGRKLLLSFVKTLKEMGQDLWRLVLVNNGVTLTIEGSELLPALTELEGSGVKILVCGTCLTHFGLLEKKCVGETTNMLDIVTAMQLADSVITL